MDPSVEQLDAEARAAAAAAAQAEVARAAAQAEADAREKADESAVYELGKTALAALKSIQDQLLGIMDPDDENLYKYRREPWKDVRSGRVDYGRYMTRSLLVYTAPCYRNTPLRLENDLPVPTSAAVFVEEQRKFVKLTNPNHVLNEHVPTRPDCNRRRVFLDLVRQILCPFVQ